MFSVFPLSYRNIKFRKTHKSCGNISHPPKVSLVFPNLDKNTVHVFYKFLNHYMHLWDMLFLGSYMKATTTSNLYSPLVTFILL